jgi:Ni,Fe-hydrogenase III component G
MPAKQTMSPALPGSSEARIGESMQTLPSCVLLISRRYEREVWDMYGVFFGGHPDVYVLLFGW